MQLITNLLPFFFRSTGFFEKVIETTQNIYVLYFFKEVVQDT